MTASSRRTFVLFAASSKVDEVRKGGIASVRKTLGRIAREALWGEEYGA